MPELEDLPSRLARNIRQLRDARGLTQQQMAKASGLPRATWANLESGGGNPTLQVLHKVARALQISLEELIATPKAACQFYPRASLPARMRGDVEVRRLLPDVLPGVDAERISIPPKSTLVGVPHTPGTREYLTCESGELVLTAAGEQWRLTPGDVVVFRGDQRHSYHNPGARPAIGYSVVLLTPP
jgi:XRE family transcriptional regulator, regulator of sulfur utilization